MQPYTNLLKVLINQSNQYFKSLLFIKKLKDIACKFEGGRIIQIRYDYVFQYNYGMLPSHDKDNKTKVICHWRKQNSKVLLRAFLAFSVKQTHVLKAQGLQSLLTRCLAARLLPPTAQLERNTEFHDSNVALSPNPLLPPRVLGKSECEADRDFLPGTCCAEAHIAATCFEESSQHQGSLQILNLQVRRHSMWHVEVVF